jgi:hypothetical protein
MTQFKNSTSVRMKYIHLTTFVLAILLLSNSATMFAQTGNVNFTGTWSFNEAKSTQAEGGFRFAPSQMAITQDGTNLSLESTRKNQDGEDVKSTSKFTLDGKECSNVAFGNSTRKSVVTWSADGKTLSFAHSMNFERDGTTQEFKSTESWKLTDNKTLSVETVMNFQGEDRKTTNVYDKK